MLLLLLNGTSTAKGHQRHDTVDTSFGVGSCSVGLIEGVIEDRVILRKFGLR